MNLEINQAIEKIADSYELDPDVVKAIVTQESNYNPYAIRYEPVYKYLYDVTHFSQFLLISTDTEMMTQKCSWGLGQIMGAVAREQGHVGPMGQLFDVDVNIKHICILIQKLALKAKSLEAVFSSYNDGLGALLKVKDGIYPNQGYVSSCLSFYNALKGKAG
jgi:Transglycosylase SLT domain